MAPKYRTEISDEDLYKLYLDAGRDASKLAPKFGCVPSTMRTRVRKMLARVEAHPIAEPRDPELINRVAELLQRSNVDPNTIQRIRGLKLKSYGVAIKNAEGKIETEGLYSTSFQADPIVNADDNPCLTQAPPITVLYSPHDAPRIARRLRIVCIISDAQIGFLRASDGSLDTIHDLAALDVTKQIIAAEQPDELLSIGDWIDFTTFSRWPQHTEFAGTAQASIDDASRILGEMISAAGRKCTKRTLVSGNHDIRLETYALNNAKAYLGLKRAGKPDEWPVLSLPYMLRLDDLDVAYHGNYPAGEHWITDGLVAMHAPPKKLEISASVIHGHLHSITRTPSVAHGRFGRQTYSIFDVGCVCKVGSTDEPTRLIRTLTPSDRARTNWLQGTAVVEILEGKIPRHQVSQVEIKDGVAIHGGQTFTAVGLDADAA